MSASRADEDPWTALARQRAAHRAYAARGLLGEELVREFSARTGFVQCRDGQVPRFRALSVKVERPPRCRVVIRADIAVYDGMRGGWAGGGKRAKLERVLGAADEPIVRRLAAAAAHVPPEGIPVGEGGLGPVLLPLVLIVGGVALAFLLALAWIFLA